MFKKLKLESIGSFGLRRIRFLLLLLIFTGFESFGQNYLVENSVRTRFSSDKEVYFGKKGGVYVFGLMDTTLQVNFSSSGDIESLAEYSELEIPRNAEILGVFRDSVLLRTTIKFGQGIEVKGFAMVPFDGGQTRAWQSGLSEQGNHRDGFWYTNKKVPGGYKVDRYNIVNERLDASITYSGSDSLIFLVLSNEKWLGLFLEEESRKSIIKYNELSVGWIPFPYPLNSSKNVTNFALKGDSEFMLVYRDTSENFGWSQFKISELENSSEQSDSIIVGDYTFFYNVDSLQTIGGVNADLQATGSSQIQVIPTDPASLQSVQDTGRFSVLVQSFKNSKDAFEFLNELVKVLPGAKAVRRKQNVDVVGPQRTSLSSVKADSAFLAVKNISSRISASRDFTPIPSLYVSLYIKDKSDNQPLVANVDVFSRREDEILASGIVENGRVYFVFPKEQADIGLTVTSDGFLPKSIRVSLADFTTTQKFSEIIALDRIPKEKEFSIELNNILFDFDSDELTKVSQKELVNVTNLLSSYTIDTLEIIGHCDSLGTDAYNQRLGLNRAKSVATFIKSQKLNATPKVTSMGELSPLLSNSTEFGRSLNRRVEFKMSISDQESEKVWNLESSSPKEKDSGTASTETSGSNL